MPKDAKGPFPTILWIHGGGWVEGDKRKEPNGISILAPLLVSKGFVAVSCNYRLAPKHRHPAQVDDVQRVVRWLRANAEKYHIDPDRIGAVGISAGGHLASMLAVQETRTKHKDDLDKFSSGLQTAISLNGPTDLRDTPELKTGILDKAIQNLLGDQSGSKEARDDASPIAFVSKDSAPMLFIVGTKDTLVPMAHSKLMANILKAKNVEAEVLALEGAGHAIFPSITPRARDAIVEWFGKKLKPEGGKVIRGLQMSLSVPRPRATLTKDGHFMEPLVMKLTVTNTTTEPITFDAFDMFWMHLNLDAKGPDADSVALNDYRSRIGPRGVKPTEADFPIIKAGGQWSKEIRVTGEWGPGRVFTFKKAGIYRFKVTYHCDEREKNTAVGMGLGSGSWFGTVSSNEVSIDAVNGTELKP